MKNSILLSLALLIAVVLWMLSGVFAKAPDHVPSGAEPDAPATTLMKVQVRPMQSQLVERRIVIQGQLESLRQVTVKAETGSRVVAIAVENGKRVSAGDVLVRLAGEDRQDRIAQALAEVESQQLEVAANRQLQQQGLQAETRLKAAEAALAAARANLKRARLDYEYIRVKAPFDGIVEQRFVEIGSHVQRGDPVALVVDKSRLKAVGRVSQQSAHQVRLGQAVDVQLLTGQQTEGRISFISGLGDSETRSFRVEAEVPNSDGQFNAGVSAELSIAVGEEQAHFLSPSMLSLNDQGDIGVKSVAADDRVQFHSVELLRSEADGIWLTGLPDRVRVITQGQGFVNAGDAVTAVAESNG